MTSLADVAKNLETARRLLQRRARTRRLPRRAAGEFLLHGPQRGGAARGRRSRRRRARPGPSPRRRASSGSGSSPARSRSRSPGEARPANACVVVRRRRQARGALRQDPPVRRRPAGRARSATANRRTRGPARRPCSWTRRRAARPDRLLRLALPGAVPPTGLAREPKSFSVPSAFTEPDRPRALGSRCCGPGPSRTFAT